MNREQKLEVIRTACVQAKPALSVGPEHPDKNQGPVDRAVRLADVLLALNRIGRFGHTYRINRDDQVFVDDDTYSFSRLWDLRTDDLSRQPND